MSIQSWQQELKEIQHRKRKEQNSAKYAEKIEYLPERTTVALCKLERGHNCQDDHHSQNGKCIQSWQMFLVWIKCIHACMYVIQSGWNQKIHIYKIGL